MLLLVLIERKDQASGRRPTFNDQHASVLYLQSDPIVINFGTAILPKQPQ